MLQRRLIVGVATAAVLLAPTACGVASSGDPDEPNGLPTPIEDAVIRPGVTALQEAPAVACEANRRSLLAAIDTYEVLNGELPGDEATLVGAGLLRRETSDWNVVDGRIVAENPACGPTGDVTPTTVDAPSDG